MGKRIDPKTITATKKQPTKAQKLLANLDVKRWHDNLARGSPITAEVRLRRLSKFCEIHKTTPMELANLGMRDVKSITDLLEDHISYMEERDYSPGYIEGFIRALKSWLSHFDVEIKRKIKVKNSGTTPTLQKERVPNGEEMAEILARAPLRTTAIISLMAKSGLRPEVLGNYNGTDGLKIKDLPDIMIHQGEVKCIKTPIRVMVRPELSKARHKYFTYLTSSGTKILIAYLNARLVEGQPLNGESAVIAPDYRYKISHIRCNGRSCLSTKQISLLVRKTFRPRFDWRPYVLRAYFDTQLLIAESKGKIAHDFRVFFMGHKGSMEARYTTNKEILPDDLTQEMSEAFVRCEEFLDLENAGKKDPTLEQKQQIQQTVQNATPEQLGSMLEMLQKMGIGKMSPGSA